MTPTYRYSEPQPPPGSLLSGPCVVFEQDGRLLRCTARTWKEMGSNKLYTNVIDMVRDMSVDEGLVKSLERRIKAKERREKRA